MGGQSPHDDPERPPPPPQSSNRLPHWQRLFYRYDVWGNLVSRRHGLNEQHYTYDADNRLIRARGSGPQGEFSAHYHYDALGRRSRKEVTFAGKAPQTTRFLWQGYRLLQEQRANGTRRTWSYDPESPWTPLAAIEQAGEGPQADIYWLNTDLNSAPLEVTDADGRLRWSGQYDTFGRLQGQTTAGAAQRTGPVYDQPLRYAGQYADSETGLHYNLFRYYEPDVGRFTTQDPVGLAGGLNLYAYAPNPYGWVDPLGLSRCKPGTASGEGSKIEGKWLRGTHGNAGLFPSSVADKLRGRQFKSFDDFRENVWKEVGNDSHLSQQFRPSNITRMKSGKAPISHNSQWNGKNKSYVLHHRTPIQHGGGIYDVDNLIVVTPRYHLDVLDRAYHF
ncbi:RHS domain-containing protein [Erwinia amylovora]|nr:Rhs-family protein [Erwinia amylovora]QKZ11048.1 RHS domain-containing protein [Erwinia amylovora]QPG16210.1 RHS domain-containing protein [Erwinia amylovora]